MTENNKLDNERIKQLEEKYGRICVLIGSANRPTEVALLLHSFRYSTYKLLDFFIYDDASSTPINAFHFLVAIMERLKEEGHKVRFECGSKNLGIPKMRQKMVDAAMEHFPENLLYLRIDDDTLPSSDYVEKLLEVIDNGYDIASGLTPPVYTPEFKRETKFVKPIINRVVLDKEGNFIKNGDDCGHTYLTKEIIPTHHFRSSALIKREVHEKIKYENNLTKCGWREEEFFSFRAILAGFKIGVHTGAIHYHLITPSGGQRTADYNQQHQLQDDMFRSFTKRLYQKYGDFPKKYEDEIIQWTKDTNQ